MIKEQPFYFRLTVKMLLLILIVAILVFAKEILIPFTIAGFFSFLLLPVSQKLEQFKLPRAVAIIISIIIAIAFFGALLYFFYSQVLSFADDWPELRKNINQKLETFHQYIRDNF